MGNRRAPVPLSRLVDFLHCAVAICWTGCPRAGRIGVLDLVQAFQLPRRTRFHEVEQRLRCSVCVAADKITGAAEWK